MDDPSRMLFVSALSEDDRFLLIEETGEVPFEFRFRLNRTTSHNKSHAVCSSLLKTHRTNLLYRSEPAFHSSIHVALPVHARVFSRKDDPSMRPGKPLA